MNLLYLKMKGGYRFGKKLYNRHSIFGSAQEAGVSYIFGNFGSDHPALIEGLALDTKGNQNFPNVIISPQ